MAASMAYLPSKLDMVVLEPSCYQAGARKSHVLQIIQAPRANLLPVTVHMYEYLSAVWFLLV